MHPKSHINVTLLALDHYLQHSTSLSSAFAQQGVKQALVQGTKQEDSPSLIRACNWHFYPANPQLKRATKNLFGLRQLQLNPCSKVILKQRCKNLNHLLKQGISTEVFSHFGRILHHIQDMSTPSHVVPIYHGLLVHDRYEVFLRQHWDAVASKIDLDTLATGTMTPPKSFSDIYHHAAQRLHGTLNACDFTFPVNIDHQASTVNAKHIWQSYTKPRPWSYQSAPLNIQGFGQFGPIGKHFGKTTPFEHAGRTYHVALSAYVELAAKLTTYALKDSLQALQLFNASLNQALLKS